MSSNSPATFAVERKYGKVTERDRNTIGGHPYLDPGRPWPVCDCGKRMALFFQLQIPYQIPEFGGGQLLVFQCPEHTDAPCAPNTQLPERFWEQPPADFQRQCWRILVLRDFARSEESDPNFTPARLWWTERADQDDDDQPYYGYKIGGTPYWVQDPENYRCTCGADLAFLCQVPEDYQFRDYAIRGKHFHSVEDGLFVGNQVYILACPARCDPAAAWPVCQN